MQDDGSSGSSSHSIRRGVVVLVVRIGNGLNAPSQLEKQQTEEFDDVGWFQSWGGFAPVPRHPDCEPVTSP
jgi:hypothetical protein